MKGFIALITELHLKNFYVGVPKLIQPSTMGGHHHRHKLVISHHFKVWWRQAVTSLWQGRASTNHHFCQSRQWCCRPLPQTPRQFHLELNQHAQSMTLVITYLVFCIRGRKRGINLKFQLQFYGCVPIILVESF